MFQENPPVLSPPTSGQGLATALPWLMAEMHRINLLHQAGHRPEAIEQFHALASMAIRTQREDLTGQGYVIHGHTIRHQRMPHSRAAAAGQADRAVPARPADVAAADRRARAGLCRSVRHRAVRAARPWCVGRSGRCVAGGIRGGICRADRHRTAACRKPVRHRRVARRSGCAGAGASAAGSDTQCHSARHAVPSHPPGSRGVDQRVVANTRQSALSRRICSEIMGFDPADARGAHDAAPSTWCETRRSTACSSWAAISDRRASPLSSRHRYRRVAGGESATADAAASSGTGHAVLLDNPDGARAALQTFIVDRTIAHDADP